MTLAIFDVDGTLVDSQAIIVEAQRRTFDALGLPPPSREAGLAIVGLSLPEAFAALVGPTGPVEVLVSAYKTAFHALRAEDIVPEPLFPGAADAIARLRMLPGLALGIATGKSRRGVAHLLEREGWPGAFATVQTADDAPSKPHPGMIERAMAETGARPGETLMIGDSSYDMEMARAAGVTAVAVSWGYHPPEALVRAGAAVIVESWAELAELVEARLACAA